MLRHNSGVAGLLHALGPQGDYSGCAHVGKLCDYQSMDFGW
jgi:hypothetical protein